MNYSIRISQELSLIFLNPIKVQNFPFVHLITSNINLKNVASEAQTYEENANLTKFKWVYSCYCHQVMKYWAACNFPQLSISSRTKDMNINVFWLNCFYM